MAKYDFTSSLERDFTFSINGEEFTFRKPTVREMRELAKNFSQVEKEEDPDLQAELSDKAMQLLYGFITPGNIAEVLDEQPIAVQHAFIETVKAELSPKK